MSALKHLKTLQHVSIIIQIIFREHEGSLLKSLDLKVLCGEVCWSPTYFSTQNATNTHQTLCCHITTTDLYNLKVNFYKTFKFSDFNKELKAP